jgi:hypothetical protein
MAKRSWVLIILGLFLFPIASLLSQEVVKTKDGRSVLLKPDGTWVYLEEKAPPGAATAPSPNPAQAKANSGTNLTPTPANTASSDEQKATTGARKSGETDTGLKTPSGQTIYEGPRGGHYHYSKSGKKVYERRR